MEKPPRPSVDAPSTMNADEKHARHSADPRRHSDLEVGTGVVLSGDERDSEVHFSLWSTLGISYSVTATPIAIGTYLAVSIGVGGAPVYVYAYILSAFMNSIVCLCLAELASAFPHSSGQIYWTRILGPSTSAKVLSYMVGWMTSAGWCFFTAATPLFLGSLIPAGVAVAFPDYVFQQWHAYLIYVACLLLSLLVNVPPVFRYYNSILNSAVPFINFAAIFLLISLLVRATPKQSASAVFTVFVNETGWTSNGVVFFLGILPGCTCVQAFDSATHITDELDNPKRQVPQVMLGSAILGALSGFVMLIVYLFCNVAPENLLDPVGGQPIIQLLQDALRSLPLTVIGSILIIVSFIYPSFAILTTFSRVWWSIARSGSVPFSATFAKLSGSNRIPTNALLFCTAISIVLGAIQLGSTTAINAILGSGNICMFLSYIMPIGCLLYRGRDSLPKDRYINLGRFGPVLNVIAVTWALFATVWLCFPLYLPATGSTMNYASAVSGAVVLIATVNWFAYSRTRQE